MGAPLNHVLLTGVWRMGGVPGERARGQLSFEEGLEKPLFPSGQDPRGSVTWPGYPELCWGADLPCPGTGLMGCSVCAVAAAAHVISHPSGWGVYDGRGCCCELSDLSSRSWHQRAVYMSFPSVRPGIPLFLGPLRVSQGNTAGV